VRQNIASLSTSQLESLRNGVAAMKARPDSDPKSWRFQANIHGTMDPVTSPLFNQCEHGTLLFFAWHRGYLYYFERILRQASGDPNLTLPYWDWSTAPALPEAYRLPANPGNSLYEASRHINDGSALPPQVVVDDLNTALAQIPFPPSGFVGFSPSLEGSPHGAVHVLIGGLMGSVPTAANDSIFWLHHGNIDRVWNQWLNLNAGRVNPSDAAYLDTPYSFADEHGNTVTRTVRELSNSEQLGYAYDDVPNPPTVPSAAARSRVMQAMVGQQTLRAASTEEGDAPPAERKPLGFKPVTVKLQLSPQHGAALKAKAAAASPDKPGAILLQIEGLSVAEVPNFTYAVYLNLPAEEVDPARIKPHYVGSLNFFGKDSEHAGKPHDDHAGGKGLADTFDVTAVVARLRKANRWNPEAVSVTLRPLTPIPPKGGEEKLRQRSEASAEKAKISYQRINLLVTT
jgi:tyrosinase-like protein/polyphenol oxidase-like protein